jgi:predicted nucleic acid-binding protein
MARFSLVIDASIGVKWFSTQGESGIPQAVQLLDSIGQNDSEVMVPDLFYYEVTNALAYKKILSTKELQSAVSDLFALEMKLIPVDSSLLTRSVEIARQHNITVYDALYAAIAIANRCPLVTANPRHQKNELGCRVIAIEEWRKPDRYYLT